MKSKTPSFVLELPLETSSMQETAILTRLEAGRHLYNACLGEALKRLDLIRQSRAFKKIIVLPAGKERSEKFRNLNGEYGFTEYALHDYAGAIRDSWICEHINSHVTQKIATRAFKAVQKKAFGKAKNVRFKGINQFDTLEGKNNQTGLIFRDNTLYWSRLEIPCVIDETNKVIAYGLKPEHRIKYCRIVRRKINSKNRFYVQLILEGKPYQKHEHKIGNEEIGLDVGPSTIAIVGGTKAELKQFCSELVPKQKEKRKLQRRMDRQRRANNSENYNTNGTVKKGRKKWKKSNHYNKTRSKAAELDRKLVAHRKSLHGKDSNEIIAMGTRIKTEKIPYISWQKNFGKSVLMRAPSMFIRNLKRKAENAGGYLNEFPTNSTKLSQVCHICGNVVKKPLSQRWHICCGIEMQRDLYSSFLSKCIDVSTGSHSQSKVALARSGTSPERGGIKGNSICKWREDRSCQLRSRPETEWIAR
ncbi:MAG TPA: transposase [Candidatus Limnocylindrales bacterium]|nr:transposase [Candidatus Limnocylindrales bacterium]